MGTPFEDPNVVELDSHNNSTSELSLVDDQEINEDYEAYKEEGDEDIEGEESEEGESDGEEVAAEDASETDDSDALYDIEDEDDDKEYKMPQEAHANIYENIIYAGLRLQQSDDPDMREPSLVYLSDCVLTKCEVKYRYKVDAAWRLFEHAYRSEYLFEIIANSCISFIIKILEKRQLNERSRFRRDMERKRNTILAWFAEIEEEWRREKANARERLQLDEDPVLFQNPRIGNTEAIAQQPFRTEDPSYSDEELDEYPDVEEAACMMTMISWRQIKRKQQR